MTSVTATPATAAALGLEQLAVRHQRGLWRYLRVLGARADVADDLLQEALLVAFEKGVPQDADAGAFLRGVARNLWLRSRQRWARRRETALADEVDALWVRVGERDDGDAAVDAMTACLQRLEARSRKALELLYRDQTPRAAVAAAVGLRPNGLKMLLQRARQALRTCMENRLS